MIGKPIPKRDTVAGQLLPVTENSCEVTDLVSDGGDRKSTPQAGRSCSSWIVVRVRSAFMMMAKRTPLRV